MLKKISILFVVGIILFSSLTVQAALAQKGELDPNTPISNVDGILPMPNTKHLALPRPFEGTGEILQRADQSIVPSRTAKSLVMTNPGSVIGVDNRFKVPTTTKYPNRAIAYLVITWVNGASGACTGWFIGPRTVATAGHCVYNTSSGPAHGWAKSILIYPGRNGASTPYGSTTSHKLFAVTGWTTSANPNYDYGAIQTNDLTGKVVGAFSWRTQTSNVFAGKYSVRGYPGDKPPATMWSMQSPISNANTFRLWYQLDTSGGQSGSPLFGPFNGVCCYAFGVHTYGASLPPYSGNSATRITQAVSNNFAAWRAAAYP